MRMITKVIALRARRDADGHRRVKRRCWEMYKIRRWHGLTGPDRPRPAPGQGAYEGDGRASGRPRACLPSYTLGVRWSIDRRVQPGRCDSLRSDPRPPARSVPESRMSAFLDLGPVAMGLEGGQETRASSPSGANDRVQAGRTAGILVNGFGRLVTKDLADQLRSRYQAACPHAPDGQRPPGRVSWIRAITSDQRRSSGCKPRCTRKAPRSL